MTILLRKKKYLLLPCAFWILPLLMYFNPGVEATSLPPTVLAQTLEAPKVKAEQLLAQGIEQLDANQFDAALQSFQLTLNIYRQSGNRFGEAVALNNLGVAYDYQGQYEEAIAFHRESMKIFWEIGNRPEIGASLNNQCIAHRHQGEYQKAIALCHGAIGIFRNMANLPNGNRSTSRKRQAVALNNMGIAYEMLADYERAIGYFQEALITAKDNGDARGEVITLKNLEEAYSKLGQSERAKEFEQEALAISQKISEAVGTGAIASRNDYLLVRQNQESLAFIFSSQSVNIMEATPKATQGAP